MLAFNKLLDILIKLSVSLAFGLLLLKSEGTTTLFSFIKNKKLNLNFNIFLFTFPLFLGVNEINSQTVFYTQDFETTNDWTLSPAFNPFNYGNYWYYTGAPGDFHSGTKSLQIWKYNSSGWNRNYSKNTATNQYNITASKTFNFSTIPCGSILKMTYWVLCNGETGYDDLIVNVNSVKIQGPLSDITSWQQKSIDLSSYVGNSSVTISFSWRNDNTTSNDPAARIDDIEIAYNPLLTANAGGDSIICSGSTSQLLGTSTAQALGTTTTQSKIMTVEVLDSDQIETSISVSGAPNNAKITSLTFTPRVWVWDGSSYFVSCNHYGSWVKMQYWNGANWLDIANCNLPITISNYNGNTVNGTIIKIRTIDIDGVDDYVLTDLLNVEAKYEVTSPISYSWSPASGLSSSTISNPIATPTTTTTYTMTATAGGCSVSDDVKVTVTPLNTTTSSSFPTLCINSILTNITHNTTGATGIGTVSNLPSGVSATWASNKITISGTPTSSGTFSYSIPLTGGCGTVSATGTITVNPKPSTSSIYHE